jgi:hypothetical protein
LKRSSRLISAAKVGAGKTALAANAPQTANANGRNLLCLRNLFKLFSCFENTYGMAILLGLVAGWEISPGLPDLKNKLQIDSLKLG